MAAATISADLRAAAPAVALRFVGIVSRVRDLIRQRLLPVTTLAPIALPLLWRFGRAITRFERLLAHFAAGHLPPLRRPGTAHAGGGVPLRVPHGWVVHLLKHEAAVYSGQLAALIDTPAVAELLELSPSAGRILRPLCHALGLPDLTRPPPPPAPEAAPAPPPEPTPPPAPEIPPWERKIKLPCPRLADRWPWNALKPGMLIPADE